MGVLSEINSQKDIKQLNIEKLNTLANELRGEIIKVTAKNGGHLASNLGIVETTVALHHVFDFPNDKLIFDVGHQCYAHKLLSGRKEKFSTIRTASGLSGFPDREESEFDPFIAGHAGTSVAASLGFCEARDNKSEDYFVVNVVGDGAIANGLNLEALTLSGTKPKNYIVILNDNGMSISKNKNGFYRFLSRHTTKRGYLSGKRALKKMFGTSFINRGLIRFRDFMKRVINKSNHFENYGFKYVGVIDGNDVKTMVSILNRVKDVAKEKAVFLHIKTTKGKGHKNAEKHADLYHGVGVNLKCESGDFATALGEKLNEFISKDKSVVAITAGMKDGTGLNIVEKENANNFYDVGIAEELAVTMAAGMSAGGLKPYVAVYSTFMQRAYDQIIHDVCLQNLPVTFCLDRAGLVGKDGKTHQGVFDLSYLTHLPNMSVFAPNTTEELKDILEYTKSFNSPVAVRYPKNSVSGITLPPLKDGLWATVKDGDGAAVICVGPRMLKLALDSANDDTLVISARSIKPLCEKTLERVKDRKIIVLEENSVIGGFGAQILSFYSQQGVSADLTCLGIKDSFVPHGDVKYQLELNGLTVENVSKFIKGNA